MAENKQEMENFEFPDEAEDKGKPVEDGVDIEIEIEDEDVDTVGGLLIKGLGELPKGGEVVSISGIELTAERVDAKRGRILSVLVRKLEQTDD